MNSKRPQKNNNKNIPGKIETNKFTFIYFIGALCTLQCGIVDMSLFIRCIRHSILRPIFFFFLLTQQETSVLSAEILLPPHCSHLYRNSGSLLNTHSCQMQTLLPDRPLHLLREPLQRNPHRNPPCLGKRAFEALQYLEP